VEKTKLGHTLLKKWINRNNNKCQQVQTVILRRHHLQTVAEMGQSPSLCQQINEIHRKFLQLPSQQVKDKKLKNIEH
jgi:hypothetical protein